MLLAEVVRHSAAHAAEDRSAEAHAAVRSAEVLPHAEVRSAEVRLHAVAVRHTVAVSVAADNAATH